MMNSFNRRLIGLLDPLKLHKPSNFTHTNSKNSIDE
jgi:hypothetical protein